MRTGRFAFLTTLFITTSAAALGGACEVDDGGLPAATPSAASAGDTEVAAQALTEATHEGSSRLWKGRMLDQRAIPVCFVGGAHRDKRSWVRSVVERQWAAAADIGFVGWDDCEAPRTNTYKIRVLITDDCKDSGSGETNGRSEVGPSLGSITDDEAATMCLQTEKGGQQISYQGMDYAWLIRDCDENDDTRRQCFESTTLHEFGHAIGFGHEHNRTDSSGTGDVVARYGALLSCKCSNDNTLNPLTDYDPDSIMNYCHRPGQNWLSQKDREGVQKAYGRRTFPPLVAGHTNEWAAAQAAAVAYGPTGDPGVSHDYTDAGLESALEARLGALDGARVVSDGENDTMAFLAWRGAQAMLGFRGARGERSACETTNHEKIGLLCYTKCPSGYESDGVHMCYQSCGAGWRGGSTLAHCQKYQEYSPGRAIDLACPAGKTSFQGLCYDVPAGYVMASAGRATRPCPEGWLDSGTTCWKPEETRARSSYTRGGPSSPSYGACPAGYTTYPLTCTNWNVVPARTINRPKTCGTREMNWAGLCYDRCASGYTSDGASLCYQNCPAGFSAVGPALCRKAMQSYAKDTVWLAGTLPGPSCPSGYALNGTKTYCYRPCGAGLERQTANLEFCAERCPAGMVDLGALGCQKQSVSKTIVSTTMSKSWQVVDNKVGRLDGPGTGALWVHRGAVGAADALYGRIKAALADVRSGRQLVIAGHGLGGSLAQIVAKRLFDDELIAIGDELYSFGAPRVAYELCTSRRDASFEKYFEGSVMPFGGLAAFSIELPEDDVPEKTDGSWLCSQRVGTDIDYDSGIVAGFRSPADDVRNYVEAALRRCLAGGQCAAAFGQQLAGSLSVSPSLPRPPSISFGF